MNSPTGKLPSVALASLSGFSISLAGLVALTSLLVIPLFMTGCGERPDSVRVDGSSTVFPVSRAAVNAYQEEFPDSRVVAGNSGTSAGFQRFFRGETHVTGASRPIREDELRRAEETGTRFLELPIGYDGLSVVTHPSNEWLDCLTVSELKRIWERGSDVERWSDVRDAFPDDPIRLYGRSPASGSFDYFTQAIMGERGNVRGDYQASDTDNAVVQGVSMDRHGLAFFGLAYYENNRDQLRLVAVDNEEGDGCVRPSVETVSDGTYQPLARPEFIYVNIDQMERNRDIEHFVRYYIRHAGDFIRQAQYVPFEPEAYDLVMERLDNRIEGSMFENGGPTVGVHITELLERMNPGEADVSAEASVSANESDSQ